MNAKRMLGATAALFLGQGCGDDRASGTSDTAAADATAPGDTDAPEETVGGNADDTSEESDAPRAEPTLFVFVEGSDEAVTVNDGLASQTPMPYAYGLQSLELLRNAVDPNPELIFDHGDDPVMVDMHAGNGVAAVPMSERPTAEFTHFRIVLTLIDATVEATVHGMPAAPSMKLPLRIRYALSDTVIDGGPAAQGDAIVSVEIGAGLQVPAHFPVVYPEPAPGAWAETVDGKTVVTFLLAEPLLVGPGASDMTCGITFFTQDSFRWSDEDGEGHADDVWDITMGTPPAFEPVLRMGANAYEAWIQ